MKPVKIFILMLMAAGAITPAFSQPAALTLEECLEYAAQSNPSMKTARMRIEAAKANVGTSVDIPNTAVELTQDATEGGGMDNGLSFSQEFDFPTVYVARRKVLKAEEALAREEYGEEFNALRGEIASAFHTVVYLKARLRLIEENMARYEEFARIAGERFEAGESSRLESLNARRLRAKMEATLHDTRLRLENSRLLLGRLTGLGEAVDANSPELSPLALPDGVGFFEASDSYASKVFDARLAIGRHNVSLARQEFWPGLSVSATSQLLIKGFNPYHIERERFSKGDFMGFSVGVTVPLFFGAKRARLQAAGREAELIRLQKEDEMQRLSSEFLQLSNDLRQAASRLDYYRQEGLEQAAEIKRLADISYELGEIDYMEYLQNLETATEIEMEYLEAVENYNQALIKIQTLKGQI